MDRDLEIEELKKRMLELHVDNDKVYLASGKIYGARRKYERAKEELKLALRHNPSNSQVYVELGRLFREQGYYSQANILLQMGLRIAPQNGEIYSELAAIYEDTKEYELAAEQLRNALENGLDNDFIRQQLSRVYSKQKSQEELKKRSLETFAKAMEAEPVEEEEISAPRATIDYIFQNGLVSVSTELKGMIKSNPNHLRARFELAWIYGWNKQYESAVEELEEIVKINQSNKKAYLELGRIFRQKKDYESSLKNLEAVLKIHPGNADALVELGMLHIEKGNYDSGIGELEKAIEHHPLCGRILSEIHSFIIAVLQDRNSVCPGRHVYLEKFNDILKRTDISNLYNPDNDFKKEFISVLEDLFPDREREIGCFVKSLPIYRLWKWRYPGMHRPDGEILYLITRLLKPALIVEAGTWMGTSTSYFAKGCYDNRKGKVITIDKGERVGFAVPDELLPYVEFYKGCDVRNVLRSIRSYHDGIDIFFHDTTDSYKLFQSELEIILEKVSSNGLIIAHDALNYTNSDLSIVDFFNEIKNEVKCYFFDTEFGLGVVKDIEKLRMIIKN